MLRIGVLGAKNGGRRPPTPSPFQGEGADRDRGAIDHSPRTGFNHSRSLCRGTIRDQRAYQYSKSCAARLNEAFHAAFSAAGRVSSSAVSTATGARKVLIPGQPSKDRRSTSLSFSSGASLTTLMAIVTFWNAELGAFSIMWPRTSKLVRATASKLSQVT